MEALTRHSIFLGASSLSLAQRLRSTPASRVFAEVFIILLFFAFTVKTESVLSFYVIQPLIKRLFGDNDDLRRELESQEADLQRLIESQRAKPPTDVPQTPQRSEAKEVD